jgi:hypothetical protein
VERELQVSLRSATPLTSEQWDALASLHPRRLHFHENALADEGVERLLAIQPVSLSLNVSPLTGKGVAALARIPTLVLLATNHTVRPTPEAENAFQNHPSLEHFSTIGPFCIEALRAPRLKKVTLQHGASNNAHVAMLAHHPNLEFLSLGQYGGATLDNGALPSIATLPELRTLKIFLADLTFADGLRHLVGHPKLASLELLEVNLPEGDLDQLRAAMPRLKITHTPMSDASRAKRDALLKRK